MDLRTNVSSTVAPSKVEKSYVCNSADYGVESLGWLEVCRTDCVYLRDGSVDPTDKFDGVLCNRRHKSCRVKLILSNIDLVITIAQKMETWTKSVGHTSWAGVTGVELCCKSCGCKEFMKAASYTWEISIF